VVARAPAGANCEDLAADFPDRRAAPLNDVARAIERTADTIRSNASRLIQGPANWEEVAQELCRNAWRVCNTHHCAAPQRPSFSISQRLIPPSYQPLPKRQRSFAGVFFCSGRFLCRLANA
jgi:hypothetical protein